MSVIYSYGERDKQGVNNLNGLPDDTKKNLYNWEEKNKLKSKQ